MREGLAILWLSIWIPIHAFGLWGKDAWRYYRDRRVRYVDWALFWAYCWRDPYLLAKREGRRLPVDPVTLTYGTTPLITIADLLARAGAKPGERFYELGCGQGRIAFFAAIRLGLRVDGFELLPTFMRVAGRIHARLGLPNLTFHQANLLEADLAQADIVYLAGTCLDDATIDALEKKALSLRPGARIITLSFPLDVPELDVVETVTVPVSWGESTAYLQVRR